MPPVTPAAALCCPARLLLLSVGQGHPQPLIPCLPWGKPSPRAIPTLLAPLDPNPPLCQVWAPLADPPQQGWTHGPSASRVLQTQPLLTVTITQVWVQIGACVTQTGAGGTRQLQGLDGPIIPVPCSFLPPPLALGEAGAPFPRGSSSPAPAETGQARVRGSQTDSPNCKEQFALCRVLRSPHSRAKPQPRVTVKAERRKAADSQPLREPAQGSARSNPRGHAEAKHQEQGGEYRLGGPADRQTDPKGESQP